MRRPAALAAAALLLLPGFLAPGPAAADELSPADVEVEISELSSAIHSPGDPLTVKVDLTSDKPGKQMITLALSVQSDVPRSRNALTAWMAGSDSSVTYVLRTREIELGKGTRRVDIDIPADSMAWGYTSSTWGPRGLEVQVLDAEQVLASDRSVMVTEPSYDLEPMDYTTIVPLTTQREDLAELPTVDALYRERIASENPPTDPINPLSYPAARAASRLARPLKDLAAPGLTVALDAALSAPDLGTTDDLAENITGFSRGRDHEVFLLPSFDADWAACSHTDPSLLDPHLARREEARKALDASGITARTDILLPAAPLTDDIANLALSHGAELLIAQSDDMPLIDDQYWTPSAHVRQDGVNAIIVDDTLSGILAGEIPRTVITEPVELTELDRRQLLLGMSAVHYRERPNDPRPFVMMVPRGDRPGEKSPEYPRMNDLLGQLSKASWLRPTTLSEIAEDEPEATMRSGLPEGQSGRGELTGEVASAAALARARIDEIARLTPVEDAYTDISSSVLEILPALAWRSAPRARADYVTDLVNLSEELHGAISAQESSTINLISQDSSLPVHVTSSLDSPATVNVKLHSSDQRLRFEDVEVTLEPKGTTTAMIPVTAIGSGNVTATVEVSDAEGHAVGRTAEITIRVRADWENMGTVAIAAFFLIILIIGIVRSARRGTRTEPVDPGSELDLASRPGARRKERARPVAEAMSGAKESADRENKVSTSGDHQADEKD